MISTLASVAIMANRRMRRHRLNRTSIIRMLLFFPVCLLFTQTVIQYVPIRMTGEMRAGTLKIQTDEASGKGTISMLIDINRRRGCVFNPGAKLGEAQLNGSRWQEVQFRWDLQAPPYSPEIGTEHRKDRSALGQWEWRIGERRSAHGMAIEDVTAVRAFMLYHCYGVLKLATIGPFYIDYGIATIATITTTQEEAPDEPRKPNPPGEALPSDRARGDTDILQPSG